MLLLAGPRTGVRGQGTFPNTGADERVPSWRASCKGAAIFPNFCLRHFVLYVAEAKRP
jgi:hypothetical protein